MDNERTVEYAATKKAYLEVEIDEIMFADLTKILERYDVEPRDETILISQSLLECISEDFISFEGVFQLTLDNNTELILFKKD